MAAALQNAELDAGLRSLFAAHPEALADPFPLYRDLRERSPVHEVEGIVVLARFADVKALLRDAARFSSRTHAGSRAAEQLARMSAEERAAFAVVAAYDGTTIARNDDPEHARLRRIAHRAFTPRRIAGLRDRIQGYLDAMLDPLPRDEPVDFKRIAYRLPLLAIADMLGVPERDTDDIHGWSEAIGRSRGVVSPDRIVDAARALDAFSAYVEAMLADLRRAPRPDSLVGTLMDAEQEERLTPEELTTMFVFLLFAGHETTTNLIGNGLLALLERRDQWEALAAAPGERAGPAVEELLRFVSPVQTVNRIATCDLELAGATVRGGQSVIGLLGSANRDPEVFERADELDIGRDGPAHLDFGFGPHFCLGAALARLEGEIAFETLARRFPRLELAADPAELRWSGNAMLRGLAELPVRLGGERR